MFFQEATDVILPFLIELLQEGLEILLVLSLDGELLALKHLVECSQFVLLTIVSAVRAILILGSVFIPSVLSSNVLMFGIQISGCSCCSESVT